MSQDWNPLFNHNNVSIEEDTVICDSFYQMRRLTVSHQRFEGGEATITRDLFWRPDAVCVLLFDPKEDAVVLIEQFRVGTIDHPRSPWLLELVAGLVEPCTPEIKRLSTHPQYRSMYSLAPPGLGVKRLICSKQ